MFADRAAKSAREDSLVQGGGGKKAPEASGVEREREQQALGAHDEASYRPILIFVYTANNCEAGLTDHRP